MRTKKTALAALAVTAMVALTGCTDSTMSAKVSKNDTVTGTFDITMHRSGLAMLAEMDPNADGEYNDADQGVTPLSPEAYFDQAFNVDETAAELAAAGVKNTTVAKVVKGDYMGFRFTFDNASFKTFNTLGLGEGAGEDAGQNSEALFRLTRTGNKVAFKFLVPADITQDPSVTIQGAADMPLPKYRIKMAFPGKVVETNGKVTGKTVTWTGKAGAKNKTLSAVATSKR